MIRIVRWLALTLVLLLVVPPAAALESRDTLSPPPPGAADLEVYALAVDPTGYPDQDAVMLLDEGHVRVERDGTSTATFRTGRQLLSEPAARAAAERSLGFHAGRQRRGRLCPGGTGAEDPTRQARHNWRPAPGRTGRPSGVATHHRRGPRRAYRAPAGSVDPRRC